MKGSCPLGKDKFPDEVWALKFAQDYNKYNAEKGYTSRQRVYECNKCNGYHLSSRYSWKEKKRKIKKENL